MLRFYKPYFSSKYSRVREIRVLTAVSFPNGHNKCTNMKLYMEVIYHHKKYWALNYRLSLMNLRYMGPKIISSLLQANILRVHSDDNIGTDFNI